MSSLLGYRYPVQPAAQQLPAPTNPINLNPQKEAEHTNVY